MENTMRPNGFIRLNREWCQGKLKPFIVKTYRYIFPLYKNVKIDLKELPYPLYDKGLKYVDDYKHNNNLLFRAFILSYLLNQQDDTKIIFEYIRNNFTKKELYDGLSNSFGNKSIIKIAEERNLLNKYDALKLMIERQYK